MATYEYNDKVKFMLPAEYVFSLETDDEGDEVVKICADECVTDEGKTGYNFVCDVSYRDYASDKEKLAAGTTTDNLLETLAAEVEDSRQMKLSGVRNTLLMSAPVPVLWELGKIFSIMATVRVSDWIVVQFSVLSIYNDDDPAANAKLYERFYDVLNATRIKGRKLPMDQVSPVKIQKALELIGDGDREYIYDDDVKFILPSTYTFSREIEGGKEIVRIQAGDYRDKEGETGYKFNCKVNYYGIDPRQFEEKITEDNVLEVLAARLEPCKKMKLSGTPNTMLVHKVMPMPTDAGSEMVFLCVGFIQFPNYIFLRLFITGSFDEEDPAENAKLFDYLCDFLKGTRVNDKMLPVNDLSPAKLREALEITSTTSTEVSKEKTPSAKKSSGSKAKSTSTSKSTTTSKAKSGSTKVTKNDWETDEYGCLIDYHVTKKEIILPDGITGIGEDLFLCNEDITSVVIPEGVDEIKDGAFWMCYNLKKVALPSTLFLIAENAFNSCEQLTSIVIPDGCEEIQEDAFTGCKKLKDIYVPDSVSYIGEDAFCTFNENTVIHTPKGSIAETFARKHGLKVDHKAAPGSSSKNSGSEAERFANAMDEVREQIAEAQSQQLSAEDMETLGEIMNGVSDLQKEFEEGQAAISKYGDYLEQKEAKEKAEAEEKDRRKAEAVAAGKSEKDTVNMYVILTNEKKLGKLYRAESEFCEIYEEDFAALSKDEVIQTRKEMLSEMEDASRCNYYAEKFKKRSVEERFAVSTRNLNNVGEEPEIDVLSKWAIENSREWYDPSEYAEVRRLMDADLANIRGQIYDQLKSVDANWTRFATCKEFLQIVIKDKAADGSDLQADYSNFQVVIGDQIVSVVIATKGTGIFRISTTIMNCFAWYWGVTVRDIWETARKNELRDEREGAYNGTNLANMALNQIRACHPETKVYSLDSNNLRTTAAPSYHTTAAKNVSTSSSSQPQAAKKEGCYIATAVYGSYDAPEVMTLRRFRDETLKRSAVGRWFIRTYYRLSPPFAAKLKDAKHINSFVRSILDKWVARLDRK